MMDPIALHKAQKRYAMYSAKFDRREKDLGTNQESREKFIKYSDECVEDFLKGNMVSLFKNIKSLSTLVLQNFQPMIPDSFHDIWLRGIESNEYYLKLCGSGGGGFMLGFTRDFEKAKTALKEYPLEVVYQF